MFGLSQFPDAGQDVPLEQFASFRMISENRFSRVLSHFLLFMLALGVGVMFLPWTQNISSKGYVTALSPAERPQTIHATIAGRIERWYVQEGQFVRQGDTILHLSEIKTEYFDPSLLVRQERQVVSKESAVVSYKDKASALDSQIEALMRMRDFKLQQARNKLIQAQLKITADSMDVLAAIADYQIARIQLARADSILQAGMMSRTDWERRQLKAQETYSKKIAAEAKLLSVRNELVNAQIEVQSIKNEYADKIAKSQSERFATLSSLYEAEGDVAKLQSLYAAYTKRSEFYYIVAPRDGYVTQALKTGIGETIKEGDPVVTIMPTTRNLAVEMYVLPVDLPLIDTGNAFDLFSMAFLHLWLRAGLQPLRVLLGAV